MESQIQICSRLSTLCHWSLSSSSTIMVSVFVFPGPPAKDMFRTLPVMDCEILDTGSSCDRMVLYLTKPFELSKWLIFTVPSYINKPIWYLWAGNNLVLFILSESGPGRSPKNASDHLFVRSVTGNRLEACHRVLPDLDAEVFRGGCYFGVVSLFFRLLFVQGFLLDCDRVNGPFVGLEGWDPPAVALKFKDRHLSVATSSKQLQPIRSRSPAETIDRSFMLGMEGHFDPLIAFFLKNGDFLFEASNR